MCGRLSCHLCHEDYKKAAAYFEESSKKFQQPEWLDTDNCGLPFKPSTNVAPTDVTPVIVSGEHYNKTARRLLQPMMWGLIPPWCKGDYKSHGLSTNNCRLEGMIGSRLYSKPLRLGQRCVVICEGFYEWQTTPGKGQKQPYFIHAPQANEVHVEDNNCWASGTWDEMNGWQGPKLLMMAGLYDVWTSPNAEQMFSYSIITMESNETLSWLHHRMPAILETEDMVEAWIDYNRVPIKEAVDMLKPPKSLEWHPVSTLVNNSRNKDKNCNKPIDLKKPKPVNQIMASWLAKAAPAKSKPDSSLLVKEDKEKSGLKRDVNSTFIAGERNIQKKMKFDKNL